MRIKKTNTRKIINDPVYGLITVPNELAFEIIGHPWFQRLRRIKQLGLTHYVYPSAQHTRFQHALGALYLMMQAVEVLRSKGHRITPEEEEGVLAAILLHDIGHGPFSHTLEESIVTDLSHEDLSVLMMDEMNHHLGNRLSLANSIFRNDYPKKFLHQLVSSQLDMDRLDYLSRDSFFTGVAEGVINTDRIIKMLTIAGDELVVESKGIYSIEKFIIARRLMYWQVYLHKTVISAEYLMINILKRAKELAFSEVPLFTTPALHPFLNLDIRITDFIGNKEWIDRFAQLDDVDIFASIKVWTGHPDPILSTLCRNLIERNLYRVIIRNEKFDKAFLAKVREKTIRHFGLKEAQTGYFIAVGTVTNNAYNPRHDKIRLLFPDKTLTDVSEASDQLNIAVLSTPVTKHLLCYPREIIM
ncbi:MAG TPA: HD domain-containing protein [Bacteroidales bacterium]|nr:HD domain-containing protein [Bacteroidales bacterium]